MSRQFITQSIVSLTYFLLTQFTFVKNFTQKNHHTIVMLFKKEKKLEWIIWFTENEQNMGSHMTNKAHTVVKWNSQIHTNILIFTEQS